MLELIFHRSYLLAASVVTYSQPPTVRSLHPSPLHSCETFERAVALSVPADCSSPVIPEGCDAPMLCQADLRSSS